MSRIANDGTKTMGELIDDTMNEMIALYWCSRSDKRAEKYEAIHFALVRFAQVLSETYTSRDGILVKDVKIGGEG